MGWGAIFHNEVYDINVIVLRDFVQYELCIAQPLTTVLVFVVKDA